MGEVEWKKYLGPYSLEEFVVIANRLLPRYLPEEVEDARVRGEVNPRLVRHLATLGVLDEALREGREARYMLRHLLQLLAARRLMAEGHSTGSVKKLTASASDAELEALLQGGAQLTVETGHGARLPLTEDALESRDTLQAPSAMSALPSESVASPSAPDVPAPNAALSFLRQIRSGQDNKPAARSRRATAPALAAQAAPTTATTTSGAAEPSRWLRLEIAPGLEIQVRDDFVLPPTPHERDELLQRAWNELKRSQSRSKGKRR